MKFILFFISGLSIFFKLDVPSVRVNYKEAVTSKEKTSLLYDKLKTVKKTDNTVLITYKGAVTALMARHQKGIKNKKELFKEGVFFIEYALKRKPNDIESRFIRLTIQQNTPAFLKYNGQKEIDKAFVLKNFKKITSSDLKKYIRDYILQSQHFSKEEKSLLVE